VTGATAGSIHSLPPPSPAAGHSRFWHAHAQRASPPPAAAGARRSPRGAPRAATGAPARAPPPAASRARSRRGQPRRPQEPLRRPPPPPRPPPRAWRPSCQARCPWRGARAALGPRHRAELPAGHAAQGLSLRGTLGRSALAEPRARRRASADDAALNKSAAATAARGPACAAHLLPAKLQVHFMATKRWLGEAHLFSCLSSSADRKPRRLPYWLTKSRSSSLTSTSLPPASLAAGGGGCTCPATHRFTAALFLEYTFYSEHQDIRVLARSLLSGLTHALSELVLELGHKPLAVVVGSHTPSWASWRAAGCRAQQPCRSPLSCRRSRFGASCQQPPLHPGAASCCQVQLSSEECKSQCSPWKNTTLLLSGAQCWEPWQPLQLEGHEEGRPTLSLSALVKHLWWQPRPHAAAHHPQCRGACSQVMKLRAAVPRRRTAAACRPGRGHVYRMAGGVSSAP